jgi:hypothetical protein
MVRCGNCGGALWGRLACISARGQRRRLGQPPGWWWRGLGQSCRWGRRGLDKRWRWRWGMGEPPWLWRRRCMGQSLIGDFTGDICVAQETNRSHGFLPCTAESSASSSFPTSECNVACDYCFEHKVPNRVSRLGITTSYASTAPSIGVRRKALMLLLAQIIYSW